MRFLSNPSTDPYFNMAFDEYCLRKFGAEGPLFYLWRNRPSVIIGLNQNAYGEVNLDFLRQHGILLARRVTGGGAVYHDLQNLNYSIIGRGVSPEPIVSALRSLGIDAAPSGRNDIFVGGRKVSGYARRVWRGQELVHGTLMFDVDLDTLSSALNVSGSKFEARGVASVRSRVANLKEFLPSFGSVMEFGETLHGLLAGKDPEFRLGSGDIAAIKTLAETRFASWDWIYGHSREISLRRRAKLACGTVEAGINLDKGRICELVFSGDFLGDEPSGFVSRRLKGVRLERQDILEALDGCPVEKAFSGADAEDLAELLAGKTE